MTLSTPKPEVTEEDAKVELRKPRTRPRKIPKDIFRGIPGK
jgi:hypothetical protein